VILKCLGIGEGESGWTERDDRSRRPRPAGVLAPTTQCSYPLSKLQPDCRLVTTIISLSDRAVKYDRVHFGEKKQIKL
jgi:hypothetical protein